MGRVRLRPLLAALALLCGRPCTAACDPPPVPDCEQAGAQATQARGLPEGLLLAIGRVESGRADRVSGKVSPWPWSVDADGRGWSFASKADAVAFVRASQSQGVQSIDVGCFQINLRSHPEAFDSLDQAFDPAANAAYAARFLTSLHARAGDWPTAIGLYHSTTPAIGEAYRDAVIADWHGDRRRNSAAAWLIAGPGWMRIIGPEPADEGSGSAHFGRSFPARLPRIVTPFG